MARRIPALALLASVLVLSGCVHESPFTGDSGYFFQAMGRDSEIVLTADTGRVKEEMPSMLATGSSVMDELFDRSTRVSVAFYKDVYGGEEEYPADLADFDYYGGLEGNYGSFTINTALAWSSQFHKEKVDGVKYYKEVWIEFVTIFGDVFVEFRAGTDLNAVFNRKGMKMKNVL